MRPAISIDVLGQSGADAAEAEDNNSSTGSDALWIVALVLGLGLSNSCRILKLKRNQRDFWRAMAGERVTGRPGDRAHGQAGTRAGRRYPGGGADERDDTSRRTCLSCCQNSFQENRPFTQLEIGHSTQ